MDLFTLSAALTLNSSEFAAGLKAAEDKGQGAVGTFSGIGNAIKNAFNFSAIVTSVGNVASSIYEVGTAYNTSFAKVGTIMNTAVMSTGEMSSAILNLSQTTGVAATEISESVYSAISGGVSTADAVSAVSTAVMLAKGGFTDTATAIDVLTTATNAYGEAAGNMEHISDVLITTQNLGKTTVGELASNMGRVIPTASAYGVSLENLGAAYAIVTSSGINTAIATTDLNAMFLEMGDSGSKVSKILKDQTGKSFSELMASGVSLGDVMGILMASVDGNTTAFSELWSSSSAGAAALALANAGADAFNGALGAMAESAGATAEAYATMSNTVSEKTNLLGNMLTVTGQKIFNSIAPMIIAGLDAITEPAAQVMEFVAEAVDGAVQTIMTVGTALGQAISEGDTEPIKEAFTSLFGENSEITSALNNFVDTAASIFSVINESITAGNPDAILSALEGIFGENSTAYQAMKTFVEMASGIMTTIADAMSAGNASEAIAAVFSGLFGDGGVVPEAIKGVIETCKSLLADIDEAIQSGDAGRIVEYLGSIFSEAAETILGSIGEAGANIVAAIYEGITGNTTTGSQVVEWFQTNIVDKVKAVFGGISEGFSTVMNGLSSTIASASNIASSIVSFFENNIVNPVANAFAPIGQAIENVIKAIQSFLGYDGSSITMTENIDVKVNTSGTAPASEWAAAAYEQAKANGYDTSGWAYRGHATGLDYVPYNDYKANLHEGERVLTKAENAQYERGESSGGGVAIDYKALANAVASALSGIVVNMDGTTVGTLVADSVSRQMARNMDSLRYMGW